MIESFRTNGFGKKDFTESGYAGSSSDSLKNCIVCHGGNAVEVFDWIESDIAKTGFVPGNKYRITATNTELGATRFGFSISPQAIDRKLLGQMIITDTTTTKLVGDDKYITYKAAGVEGTDYKTWTFYWIAPDNVNDVVFYGAFNSNFEGHKDGDKTYLSTLKLFKEGFTGLNEVTRIENLNIYPNPIVFKAFVSFQNQIKGNMTIELFTLERKMIENVYEGEVNVGSINIPISPKVVQGANYLKISNKFNQITKKIIIN